MLIGNKQLISHLCDGVALYCMRTDHHPDPAPTALTRAQPPPPHFLPYAESHMFALST